MSLTAAEHTRKLRDCRSEVTVNIPPAIVDTLNATPGDDELAYRDTADGVELLHADNAHNLLPTRKLRNHEVALINVPQPVREVLNVSAGDRLAFDFKEQSIYIEAAEQ